MSAAELSEGFVLPQGVMTYLGVSLRSGGE